MHDTQRASERSILKMRKLARLAWSGNVWAIALSFGGLAVAVTWPLAWHLRTHLLGDPTGDTGVYVWNIWIFRHELLRHGHLPFWTEHIFGFTGGADFALHNYTALAGLIGAPLIAPLGVVGTFNVLMIASIASSGWGVYLLARHLGLKPLAAWMAGAVFIAAPALTARQTAHFSLVIAAPLPLFLWALLRTLDNERTKDAMLVGALCAIATYGDAYYGIYCVLMGMVVIGCRFVRVETRRSIDHPTSRYALDALIAAVLLLVTWRLVTGVTVIRVGSLRIGMETYYTPMLALLLLALARTWVVFRPVIRIHGTEGRLLRLVGRGSLAAAVCLTLLTPLLVGIAVRAWMHRLPDTEIFWRSSPRGVDLLAYFVPNPNHPLFGNITRPWLLPDKPDAFPEFIASFSIVAVLAIGVAAWRRALPREWLIFTGFFAALSLGPFVYVAGMNTYVPGPWAFLRYVPVIGMARSPSRFALVAALGLSLLFAFAVEEWISVRRRSAALRGAEMALLTAVLAFELVAVPRPLYSAAVPDVYKLIATTDEESGRLLELPTGIRDGTSSIGDFNASSEYFQTSHRRQLIGGYLSRVSTWRRSENLRAPVLRALYALGEGHDLPAEWRDEAGTSRDDFLARSCVRYVLVNKRRATPALRTFSVDALRLRSLHEDQDYELLVPADPPPCWNGSDPR